MPLARCFTRCRAAGRAALIPYFTAGYPDADEGLGVLDAIARAGADIIELGIPFSDPLADGPTIQRASFRALEAGMSVSGALETLRTFRADHDTPVVLFSYLNPILRYGIEDFVVAASEAGAQGLLLTDLPAGVDRGLESRLTRSGLDLIRLVAPTTPTERIAVITSSATGFLYYISRTGVTGARVQMRHDLRIEVETLRKTVGLPVAVGFGISTPEQAASLARVADGVVVGSALIDRYGEGGVAGVGDLVAELRAAMDWEWEKTRTGT